jgi:outer membrane lipoprotein-sorting protein
MKKFFLITLLLPAIYGIVFSQNSRKLNSEEQKKIEQRIVEISKNIKTLQCDFVQEKTSTLVSEKAVAKGILLYQSPSALRWEYTDPTPSTLILNGENAALFDKNGKKAGNEKMLKQLGGIIISMINGSGIDSNKQFSSEFYEIDNVQIVVVLTPIQKRLKEFYNNIELKIDSKSLLANEIVLNEKTGDKTIISLINKKLDSEISQNKFTIQ